MLKLILNLLSLCRFLYSYLNENFRREFKEVLPCCTSTPSARTRSKRNQRSDRTCNGNDTVQESYAPTTSIQHHRQGCTRSEIVGIALEAIDEQTSNSPTALSINLQDSVVKYSCATHDAQLHNLELASCIKATLINCTSEVRNTD